MDLRITCDCGKLTGVARGVSPRSGNRLYCYCDDCQAYAEYLGVADRVLDAHGGTEVLQLSPACLSFAGTEHLACLKLTPKGVLRWYASCCNTPIGNTLPTRQIPYVGMVRVCFDVEDRSLDDALGPVRAGVNGRFARGDRSQVDAHDRAPLGVLVRIAVKLVGWRLRGDHKRSPLFDTDGRPVAEPICVWQQEGERR